MLKAYKYRLYPTPEQAIVINKTMGVTRFVYNLALETKIRAYKDGGVNLSVYDLQKQFTQLRHEYDWIKEVGHDSPSQTIKNIDLAFKTFFKGGGYPKFKSKRNGIKIVIQRTTCKKVDFFKNEISAGSIKNIPAKLSKVFVGEIKSIHISKTQTNKYYASILVKTDECEVAAKTPNSAIGIDLGIKDFAVLSTGEKIANPRHLRVELIRLKALQRRAMRKKKGSKNKRKANLKVALLHEKITNQRCDFLHKLSTKLISDNQTDTICVEDLGVKNMVKNHKLAQAIIDVSWSEFIRQLQYKGKWYGKNIIKINRFFASSKTCSNCNHKYDELSLEERDWTCVNCNTTHDRDINAAINIRNSGMGSPGEPVESLAIVRTKKQESMSKVKERKPPPSQLINLYKLSKK